MANDAQNLIESLMQDPELKHIYDDPVVFAKAVLGINPRFYQSKILRDKSLKKVARWGRRSGKCIYENANVITEDGPIKAKTLFSMKNRPKIISYDEESQDIKKIGFYDVLDNGVKPVFKITTETGRENYATGNHPYLTIGEDGEHKWVDIDNMSVGDKIATPSTYKDLIKGVKFGEEESRLLGYLVGDGCTSQNFVSFSNTDNEILDDLGQIVNKYNCSLVQYEHSNYCDYRIIKNINSGKYNDIIQFCQKHGLMGKLATEKQIPEVIMKGTKNDIANFLSAYWDCDGWCSINKKTYDKAHKRPKIEVGVCSSSKKLAIGIQHLLLRLGIVSRLKSKNVKYNDEYRKAWQITINDFENINKFAKQINLKSKHKQKTLQDILNVLKKQNRCGNKTLNTIPKEIWTYIKKVQKEKGLSNREVCGDEKGKRNGARLRTQYSVSKEKVNTYANNLKDEYLKRISSSSVQWEKVISIEYIGEKKTYDLSVPETHTFISDDIISHNTFSMVLYILWRAFVQPDGKRERLLVIGPYGIQVDTIFDDLRKLIQQSPILQMSMTRSVQSPQRIEFGNGSQIIGLSAGSGSGKGGSSIRGQGATYIFLDETDYLTEADINSIMGMQLEDASNIGIWCSSTPTGMRRKFWEWCTYASKTIEINNKDEWLATKDIGRCEKITTRDDSLANGWVQYHYPSWVNPKWSDEMDAELKAMFSAQGYIHEVDADFGDATTGVYNKEMIDKSRAKYTYAQMRQRTPMPDRIRIIGVDWDKYGAATQIIVSEYDDEVKKIRIVDRQEIPSTEFTFDNAVKKIFELYNFWKPKFLYIDRGYGEYQVEVLKKKIGKGIVKGFTFNQKIETIDPTDNTVDRKEVKHFMITQTAILLERGQLLLSDADEMIYKQMENYQVVNKTSIGKPIYTSENEHAHDAFTLTILGFNQEYPDIAKLLEERRKATIMKKVKKRLEDVKEKMAFDTFRNQTKKERELEEELKGEPDYVKHMKSIKYGSFNGHTRSTWGNRGLDRRPPSRRKL